MLTFSTTSIPSHQRSKGAFENKHPTLPLSACLLSNPVFWLSQLDVLTVGTQLMDSYLIRFVLD